MRADWGWCASPRCRTDFSLASTISLKYTEISDRRDRPKFIPSNFAKLYITRKSSSFCICIHLFQNLMFNEKKKILPTKLEERVLYLKARKGLTKSLVLLSLPFSDVSHESVVLQFVRLFPDHSINHSYFISYIRYNIKILDILARNYIIRILSSAFHNTL